MFRPRAEHGLGRIFLNGQYRTALAFNKILCQALAGKHIQDASGWGVIIYQNRGRATLDYVESRYDCDNLSQYTLYLFKEMAYKRQLPCLTKILGTFY